MPPKPKFSKEEIINAAFEITREDGIDSVVARSVGKRLGTSSSPIFTVFNSMDELKDEVWKLAKQRVVEYMQGIMDYSPAFKEFGMRWVRFFREEPNLYRLFFSSGATYSDTERDFAATFSELAEPVIETIREEFRITGQEAKELLRIMLIFANGLCMFLINDPDAMTEEKIGFLLSDVCIGTVLNLKLRDGGFDTDTARAMANACVNGITPTKKPNEKTALR